MTTEKTVTDSDLQAYVDNQLGPERRKDVEAYLQTHPEAAELVNDYRLLNQSIRNLYDPILDAKPPKRLQRIQAKRKTESHRLSRVAAASVWLAIGGVIGWSAHSPQVLMPTLWGLRQNIDGQETDLAQPASFAHAIYSVETKHPVEIGADQQQHLIGWLSKRLHTDIKAPDLSKNHFRLIGGRLLPSTNRMAAQFMYQHDDGSRISLYIRRGDWGNTQTAFHFSNQNGISVLYWIHGELGYALSGKIKKEELLQLSEQVYEQINLLW